MASVAPIGGRPPSYGTLHSHEHDILVPVKLAYDAKQHDPESEDGTEHVGEQRCLGAWFSLPYFKWYPRWWFNTIRGAEWFHVYLWLAKDLAWTQDWNYVGISAGCAAVLWSVFLLFQAFRMQNYVEAWHSFAQFLWLAGNAWWMIAELHDHDFPDEPKLYPAHTIHAGYIMSVALAWLFLYYLVVRPFGLIPRPSEVSAAAYDDAGVFVSRSTFLFPTWRTYENIHILFWLGKDCAWNHLWPTMWWIFAVPTVVIALDFVWTTSFHTGHGVDHAHYIVQFIWVMANLVWACGELYIPQYDEPLPLLPMTEGPEGVLTMRWWSAWILVLALAVVAGLYAVWLPAGWARRIPDAPERNDFAALDALAGAGGGGGGGSAGK